ncbi:glycosyltransferase family 4 protein [Oricola sp.]|uniref:glycosyltransferase family 4 protein n=1 Tax=Oricola sp. TaxID=1979950 RepID=UPI0025E76D3C|nr:glycosyltransferase family 4 protein [Oricola sp.]MCI5073691.1 glycosyltransferase family 4 protein [Oricola sp.]
MAPRYVPVSDTEVIATNFARRNSGGTTAVIQLVPEQAKTLKIAVLGQLLTDKVPRLRLRLRDLPALWRRPKARPFRIYHCRRNNEMIFGMILRDVLRMPIRLIFNSAAQRDHKPATKWMIRRMDAVIATSRESGSYLKVPHTVVMHGTDIERFHPPVSPEDDFAAAGLPGKYCVGCTGRIRHQKGTDLFVDAMIALLPRHPNWTAVITGQITSDNTAFADELKQRIRAAGLSERIVFLGEVPDIARWYRRMHLFVAPSRNEGFGLTPLEAMASQTPVVASTAGSYRAMIREGVNGSIFPAGDLEALTARLEPYFADPDMAARHGDAALDVVRADFSLAAEASGIREVYYALWASAAPGLAK